MAEAAKDAAQRLMTVITRRLHDELKGQPVQLKSLCASLASVVLAGALGCGHTTDMGTLSGAEMALGVLPAAGRAGAPRMVLNASRLDAGQLSVLTFNMEHRDDPAALAVMAERLAEDLKEVPDFILCQEVVFNRSRPGGPDNTAAVLAGKLGYEVRGTKRSSDREGVAILSRYPFMYYDAIQMKAQTSRLLLGFNRVSVMGEFMVPRAGLVRVVNVHLTNWGFESRVRGKQLRETLEWIAQRDAETPAAVTVLGGDFNIQPEDDELRLITDGEVASGLAFMNFNGSEPTRGSHGNPSRRVDYIFVASASGQLRMTADGERRLWVDGLTSPDNGARFWLSDHVPVLHAYAVGPAAFAGRTQPLRQAAARLE